MEGNLLLGLATERIDPMQIEAAVAAAHIKLVAFDDRNDARLHAVECDVDGLHRFIGETGEVDIDALRGERHGSDQ